MKSSVLFLKLQEHLKHYKSKVKHYDDCFDDDDMSIQGVVSRYNLENFNEIMNSSYEEFDDEVNEEELMDLISRIDNYFSLYAPDDEKFKEFIKIISIYLVFIGRKPLRPPEIKFLNGTMVYKKDDYYYCTGKKVFIKDELSLCKYCIARCE